jgi:hypothetical protein
LTDHSGRGYALSLKLRLNLSIYGSGMELRTGARPPTEGGQRGDLRLPSNPDLMWARAEDILSTWGSITMRLAARPGAPLSFTITDGAPPHARRSHAPVMAAAATDAPQLSATSNES